MTLTLNNHVVSFTHFALCIFRPQAAIVIFRQQAAIVSEKYKVLSSSHTKVYANEFDLGLK